MTVQDHSTGNAWRSTNKLDIPKRYPKDVKVLSALSDLTRVSIIYLLGTKGSMDAGEIASYFDMSKPAVSHHLSILTANDLVQRKRVGQHIYYSFDYRALAKSFREMAENMEKWSPRTDKGTDSPEAKESAD
ncbi:MAG: metalloregulator ArsR/SmtB family transcription factor [Dehalococcoidia bacterium]|nr:metalloregulator ArsR/SmtB family transcription factor [Dehalococcoidia bacterium]